MGLRNCSSQKQTIKQNKQISLNSSSNVIIFSGGDSFLNSSIRQIFFVFDKNRFFLFICISHFPFFFPFFINNFLFLFSFILKAKAIQNQIKFLMQVSNVIIDSFHTILKPKQCLFSFYRLRFVFLCLSKFYLLTAFYLKNKNKHLNKFVRVCLIFLLL